MSALLEALTLSYCLPDYDRQYNLFCYPCGLTLRADAVNTLSTRIIDERSKLIKEAHERHHLDCGKVPQWELMVRVNQPIEGPGFLIGASCSCLASQLDS